MFESPFHYGKGLDGSPKVLHRPDRRDHQEYDLIRPNADLSAIVRCIPLHVRGRNPCGRLESFRNRG